MSEFHFFQELVEVLLELSRFFFVQAAALANRAVSRHDAQL
jgi:hypothetical protein